MGFQRSRAEPRKVHVQLCNSWLPIKVAMLHPGSIALLGPGQQSGRALAGAQLGGLRRTVETNASDHIRNCSVRPPYGSQPEGHFFMHRIKKGQES